MNFSDRNAGRLLTLLISRHRSRARPLWRRKQGERWRFRTFNAGIRQQDPYPQTRVRTWVQAWLRTRIQKTALSQNFSKLCPPLLYVCQTPYSHGYCSSAVAGGMGAWVRIGNVPSTMIAAPSEIAQATVETWSTLWPATQVTLLEGTVGFLFAVLFGILIGILLYCSCIANAALLPVAFSCADHAVDFHRSPIFDLVWL